MNTNNLTNSNVNILVPLDPGKTILLNNNIKLTRGLLNDGDNKNQTNQITTDGINWSSYGTSITVGTYTFLFAGSGSPVVMKVSTNSTTGSSNTSPDAKSITTLPQRTPTNESESSLPIIPILVGIILLLVIGFGIYYFTKSKEIVNNMFNAGE